MRSGETRVRRDVRKEKNGILPRLARLACLAANAVCVLRNRLTGIGGWYRRGDKSKGSQVLSWRK